MIFTISKSSDHFMERPNPKWKPHPKSVWDKKRNCWVIDLKSPVDIINCCGKYRLVVTDRVEGPHIEIDDLSS